jgi:hypothetical protein
MAMIPPPLPWRVFGEPEAEHEYLVLLTHLPVQRLTSLPKFLNYVWRIRKQLESGPAGLVGYSLLAQPFTSNYWTLSAWTSPAALGEFITERPHSDAMRVLRETLSFRSWRWEAAGKALPPSWETALEHAGRNNQ